MRQRISGVFVVLAATLFVLLGLWRVQAASSVQKPELPYPSRPITIIVTFPPGGGTDLLARRLGAELEKKWQHPVIVENKPGASGNIGARFVAESQADGHTLLMVNSSYAINPSVFKQMGFDPKKDLTPILNMAWISSVLVVGKHSPYSSLSELRNQTDKEQLEIATCGNGTPQHLAAQMLSDAIKKPYIHVAYKGCGPALTDVLSGHVQAGFVTMASAMPFVQNHSLKVIAITAPERSMILPQAPTLAEELKRDYALDQWHGLLAPANTDPAIIEKLNHAFREIMAEEKIQHELQKLGYTPTRSTAAEFKRIIDADIERFASLVQRAQITIQ